MSIKEQARFSPIDTRSDAHSPGLPVHTPSETRPDTTWPGQVQAPPESSDTRTLLIGLVVFAAVAGIFYYITSHQPVAAPAPPIPPPTVSVSKAVVGPITQSYIVTGNLVPRDEVMVSPQIDGYAVDEVLVDEGDTVREGQVLARLSRSTLEASIAQNDAQRARGVAAIAQAKASIAEAQAAKDQADQAYARSRTLQRAGNVTVDTLDERKAAALTASARLDAAREALSAAQADLAMLEAQRKDLIIRLGYTDIKAPSAGVVSRKDVSIGQIASASGNPLFRIIRDNEIELAADLPESVLARTSAGMHAQVKVAGFATPLDGTVRLVSPEVDQTTRLGKVRIALPHADRLAIGAFGRATIDVATRKGVLLPQSAVLYGDDGAHAQVLKDGVVETRQLTIGLRTDDQAEIEKGVAAGEWVVTTAGTFLRNGDRAIAHPVGETGAPASPQAK